MSESGEVSLHSIGAGPTANFTPETFSPLTEHSKTKHEQKEKPSILNADTALFVKSSLKIGGGVLLGTVGVGATALVLPLALLGLGAGALIGRQKSMLEANSTHQKEMAIDGLLAGSLSMASYLLLSKELTTSGYKDIKHRNETPLGRQQRQLNKEIKTLASEIKFLQSKKFSDRDVSQKIGLLQEKLDRRESQVKGLVSQAVVDHIFHDVIAGTSSIPDDKKAELKKQIHAEVQQVGGKHSHAFVIEGKEYVISEVLNNKQKVVAIAVASQGSKLGSGSFGVVYELTPTLFGLTKSANTSTQQFVIKVPQSEEAAKKDGKEVSQDKKESERADMKNDAKITQHLARSGLGPSMPLPSHFIECNGSFRLILPRNDMTLAGLIKLEQNPIQANMLSFLNQAWAGLEYMHDEGVCHRDIKTENLMVRTNSDGNPELVFIDFGGSHLFDEIFSGNEFPSSHYFYNPMGMTPEYTSADIHVKKVAVHEKYEKEYNKAQNDEERSAIIQRMKNEMIPLMKQSDRFATGVAMYSMITGDETLGQSIKGVAKQPYAGIRFSDQEATRSAIDSKLLSSGLTDEQARKKIVDAILPQAQ